MLTDAEYQQTRSDLLSRSVPEEHLAGALDAIDEYDAAHKAPSTAGRERSIIEGPTGIDALERSLGTQEENTGVLAEPLRQLRQNQVASGKAPIPATALGPSQEQKKQFSFEERKTIEESRDYNLPSASGTKDIYRKPEHIPHGIGQMGVMEALPSLVGGSVDHYVEPGIDQFRRDMEGTYGPKVFHMDESSQAYKEYADRLWADVYDRAEATGTPVVRTKFAKDARWDKERLTSGPVLAAMDAIAPVASFAHGVDQGALAGIGARILPGTDAENAQKLTEASPTAALAGRIVGSASPRSIGGVAARGVAKAGRAVVPGEVADALTGGGIGSVLASGAKGAAAGGINSLAESGVEASTSKEPYDWQEASRRAIDASLWGGAIGAGLDVVGQAAGVHGQALRRENPELPEAERIGGKTSVTWGFVPGKDVAKLTEEARVIGAGSNSPEGLAASRVAEQLVPETRKLAEATRARLENEVGAYYDATDNVRRSPDHLLHQAMNHHEMNVDDLGRDIHAGQGKLARDIVQRVSSVEAVQGDSTATLKAAQAQSPNSFRMPADEARKTGFDVDAAFKRWRDRFVAQHANDPEALQHISAVEPGDLDYVVTPTGYSPRQWDLKIKELDEVARVAERGGVPKEGYAPYMETARRLRDRFPEAGPAAGRSYTLANGTEVKGYSALANEHADVLQELQNEQQAQGLVRQPGPRPDLRTQEGVFNALTSYGQGGTRYVPGDEALMSAARSAGLEREVKDIRGLYSTKTMEDLARVRGGTVIRGGTVSERNMLPPTAARLRLDPALSHLAVSPDALYAPSPLHLRGGTAGGAGAEVAARGKRKGKRVLTPEEARQLEQILLFEGGAP